MNNGRDIIKYIYYRLKETICVNYFKRYLCILKHKKKFKNHNKTIYIITTPEYGNLGDHAIAQAEIDIAKINFPEYEVFEISDSMFDEYIECLHYYLTQTDFVWFIGGGNFGIMYPKSEYNRRTVIKKCKNTKIVMFPQSNTTGTNLFDQLELKRSIKIYSRNSNVSLIARDYKSYEHMKNNFESNDVYFSPDVVLTWDITKYMQGNKISLVNFKTDKKVLFCIRQDIESSIDKKIIDNFKIDVKNRNYKIEYFDTETYKKISASERINELKKLLSIFNNIDYVITDRLHGMVLSCLVGKPCLAFDNSTKKISGLIEWISNEEVMMFDKNMSIENQTDKLFKYSDYVYDRKSNHEELLSILIKIKNK